MLQRAHQYAQQGNENSLCELSEYVAACRYAARDSWFQRPQREPRIVGTRVVSEYRVLTVCGPQYRSDFPVRRAGDGLTVSLPLYWLGTTWTLNPRNAVAASEGDNRENHC